MAYRDDILALAPTNYWTLDGNGTDLGTPPTETPTDMTANGGSNFTGAPITEDATNAFSCTTSQNSQGNVANRGYMNDYSGQPDPYGIRTFSFWCRLTDLSNPTVVFEEGGTIRNFALWGGIANRIGFQAVSADAPGLGILKFVDPVIEANRTYHFSAIWYRDRNTSGLAEIRVFLNGVEQGADSPLTDGTQSMGSHAGDIAFGNTEEDLRFYNTELINVGTAKRLAHCAIWNDVELTDTQIREELFEKGVLPTVTVTNQTELDALASTLQSGENCAIRVDVAGSITLSADNVTFSNNSIDIQYTGTGTLTWNSNVADGAPEILSTPNGGTINVAVPTTITLTGLQLNSEVRIYEAGTTTELGGVENSGTSESFPLQAAAVDVVVHALQYQYLRLENIATTGDVSLPIQQVFDRNYDNP